MMESPGRIAFSIGSFDIMWYGIFVALGIVCGILVVLYRAPKYHGISADRSFNLVILILIAALIGTRAYYVIFEWEFYGAHPAEIFNFRAGGLAIHGGLIFGCLMAALLARIYREKFFNIVDVFFVGIPLGQAIGRWGNFFNSEAHGTHTDLPWAIIVDGDTVHPTFLYESLWCLALCLILWRLDNKRIFVGQTFLLYCMLYSIERFFVEGLRTDSLMVHFPWGDFRQAQVLSVVVIVCAFFLYIWFYRRAKARGFVAVNISAAEKAEAERKLAAPEADDVPGPEAGEGKEGAGVEADAGGDKEGAEPEAEDASAEKGESEEAEAGEGKGSEETADAGEEKVSAEAEADAGDGQEGAEPEAEDASAEKDESAEVEADAGADAGNAKVAEPEAEDVSAEKDEGAEAEAGEGKGSEETADAREEKEGAEAGNAGVSEPEAEADAGEEKGAEADTGGEKGEESK